MSTHETNQTNSEVKSKERLRIESDLFYQSHVTNCTYIEDLGRFGVEYDGDDLETDLPEWATPFNAKEDDMRLISVDIDAWRSLDSIRKSVCDTIQTVIAKRDPWIVASSLNTDPVINYTPIISEAILLNTCICIEFTPSVDTPNTIDALDNAIPSGCVIDQVTKTPDNSIHSLYIKPPNTASQE